MEPRTTCSLSVSGTVLLLQRARITPAGCVRAYSARNTVPTLPVAPVTSTICPAPARVLATGLALTGLFAAVVKAAAPPARAAASGRSRRRATPVFIVSAGLVERDRLSAEPPRLNTAAFRSLPTCAANKWTNRD